LTSVFGPYAQDDEYGSRVMNPMELYHNQVTRVQGPFSLRMFHRTWGLMLIQANIHAPCTVLDFPTLDRFVEELRDNRYDMVGISSIVPNMFKVKKMCDLVRQYQPHATIVVGGHVANVPDLDARIDADYIVVHSPLLHFAREVDATVYEYYRHVAEQVDIGIALWSHPDAGYLMSPELCARLAELPNVVAIKYSVPRDMYVKLTRLAGGKLIVSTASEEEWFDNIVELGWQVYLCSTPPYLLQTTDDRRMQEYTALAMRGEIDRARAVRDSLEPVRQALKRTRPQGTPQAHQKYWQELLGQAGGPVRRPLLDLTEDEKAATRAAFDGCGLKVDAAARRAAA